MAFVRVSKEEQGGAHGGASIPIKKSKGVRVVTNSTHEKELAVGQAKGGKRKLEYDPDFLFENVPEKQGVRA